MRKHMCAAFQRQTYRRCCHLLMFVQSAISHSELLSTAWHWGFSDRSRLGGSRTIHPPSVVNGDCIQRIPSVSVLSRDILGIPQTRLHKARERRSCSHTVCVKSE